MKQIVVVGIAVLFIVGVLSGCSEEASTIGIKIESFYPFDAEGYFTVDGIKIRNFTISMFNTSTFEVDKSELPDQQYHNVTFYIESVGTMGEQINATASCDRVTERTKFVLSVTCTLSCLSYK